MFKIKLTLLILTAVTVFGATAGPLTRLMPLKLTINNAGVEHEIGFADAPTSELSRDHKLNHIVLNDLDTVFERTGQTSFRLKFTKPLLINLIDSTTGITRPQLMIRHLNFAADEKMVDTLELISGLPIDEVFSFENIDEEALRLERLLKAHGPDYFTGRKLVYLPALYLFTGLKALVSLSDVNQNEARKPLELSLNLYQVITTRGEVDPSPQAVSSGLQDHKPLFDSTVQDLLKTVESTYAVEFQALTQTPRPPAAPVPNSNSNVIPFPKRTCSNALER